jgi:hypothetical protein
MKLSRTILAIAAACTVAFAGAKAAPITGLLNISGTATFNHPLATATSVTAFTGVTVGGGNTGVFSSIPIGTAVTMATTYTFNPSTATPALWSVGGFTFDLLSSIVVQRSKNFLSISGRGIISGNGYDATPAVWAFSTQNAGGNSHRTFTFSANTEGVPDGGMTVTLLGVGLLGLTAFRAKFPRR